LPAGEISPPSMDQPFVTGRALTLAGPVPTVSATLNRTDRLGALLVRWRFGRSSYTVDPGLYAVGSPDERAPVLVTANYKLSFDTVRAELAGRDAWLLVLDTRGINVWCAAGKGTFGTDEVCLRIDAAALPMVVTHGTIVLPQLGAPGVSAPEVKRRTGFRAVYGPVRAADLPAFLDAGMRATPEMRRVTFPLQDRLALVPVELVGAAGIGLAIVAAATLVGGFGPGIWSLARALARGPIAAAGAAAAILGGALLAPVLLPWVPGRMFSVKGALVAAPLAAGLIAVAAAGSRVSAASLAAAFLLAVAGSSFAAMNFTGSSTFTSLSGVLVEMRRSLPWQVGGAALAAVLWIAGGWV
jgi:hypothetical protein